MIKYETYHLSKEEILALYKIIGHISGDQMRSEFGLNAYETELVMEIAGNTPSDDE